MYIRDIIRKKRTKGMLTEEEIRFFIFGYFKDEISEAQASAVLTAMHIYGVSDKELMYMITAISETGEELELYRTSNKIVDIHSLGGISDKIILILLSIFNSLGIPTAKIIGRELGMEDRLLSLSGYEIENDLNMFKENIKKNNVAILKSVKNLAPVEEKLYKLRHEIACDSNIALIGTSIMSQKMAIGCNNIFFEITYGKNAYVKTLRDARILAKTLKKIGSILLRNVGCCITKLNEPTGKEFGNLLELKEVYEYLNGKEVSDINEIVLKFGSNILINSNYCNDKNKCIKLIENAIKSKEALKSFEKMIKSQGGNIEILKGDIKAKNIIPIISTKSGYIEEIDINKLRTLSKYINAIRTVNTDKIDIGAGITFAKKVGDTIKIGEILAYINTNDDTKIEKSVEQAKEIFNISDRIVKKTPRIVWEV